VAIRVLPFLIAFLLVMVVYRSGNMAQKSQDISALEMLSTLQIGIEGSHAEGGEAPTPPPAAEATPAEAAKTPAASVAPNTPEATPVKGGIKEEDRKQGWDLPPGSSQYFSPAEVEILQGLDHRRKQLEQREKELNLRQTMLDAIEKNIDNKITEMRQAKKELETVVATYETKKREKSKGLVKIYETMKPKEAARIFDELQMSILVEVAEQMKEGRLAEILAQMKPERAKDLTVQLANNRQSQPSIQEKK
jgi:flagellar motility protein MotE (MotC chaperone)